MKSNLIKSICVVMIFIFATVVFPIRVFAADNQIVLNQIHIRDGETVERVSYKNVEIVSIKTGTKLTATVVVGGITHFIESDDINPIFFITTDGETATYDRRDYIAGKRQHSQLLSDPYFGSPYTSQLCGTKAIGAPYYTTAFAYESYDFFEYDYNWGAFAAKTGIELIIAYFTWAPPFTIISLLAAVFALNNIGDAIKKGIILEDLLVQQEWDRQCYINNALWAHEWKIELAGVATVFSDDGLTSQERRIVDYSYSPYFFDILDMRFKCF